MEHNKRFLSELKQTLYKKIFLFYVRVTAAHRLKPKKRLRFETDVVGHCNLNCKCCYHFSPLVKEDFVNLENFEKDFSRLSDLAGRNNDNIDIMGGEPLLHPQIIKLIEIARKYFDGPVNIVTNGILLEKMAGDFWEACRKNNIKIIVTAYPVKLNYKLIKKIAKTNNVKIKFRLQFSNKHTWCRLPRDLNGNQNITENIKYCVVANFCIFLKDGKLSTCCLPLLAGRFNDYFNTSMNVSPGDFIDIYKANNIKEIYEFLSKPIPFCRFCRVKDWEIGIEWGTSKKEISEWV